MLCRHCHVRRATRPRHLCRGCHADPSIRDLYPPTSKYGRRGLGNFYCSPPLPVPTRAIPGSPEKVAVLVQRAALRQQLFHPEDATLLDAVAHLARVG